MQAPFIHPNGNSCACARYRGPAVQLSYSQTHASVGWHLLLSSLGQGCGLARNSSWIEVAAYPFSVPKRLCKSDSIMTDRLIQRITFHHLACTWLRHTRTSSTSVWPAVGFVCQAHSLSGNAGQRCQRPGLRRCTVPAVCADVLRRASAQSQRSETPVL